MTTLETLRSDLSKIGNAIRNKFNKHFAITKVANDETQMVRFGIGKHKNMNWFARLDLWHFGYRLTARDPYVATINGKKMKQAEYNKFISNLEGARGPVGLAG